MLFTPTSPAFPGHILLVASGGACPGGPAILEAAFDVARGSQQPDGSRTKLFVARGGLGRLINGDPSCLTEVTSGNLRPNSLCEAPILSFCKGGPSSDHAEQERLVRDLRARGIRYLLLWGGQYSLAMLANTAAASVRLVAGGETDMQLLVGGLVKSIDNDANIRAGWDSIGFSSAVGALRRTLVGLANDARNSDTMVHIPILAGNQVGFLADRASRRADIPLYLIPERLPKNCRLDFIIDIILGAWLKNALRPVPVTHLVVPIAEGVLAMLDPQSCVGLAEAKAKSQEGVTANHYPFAQLVQQVGTGAFSQVKLPYGLKVSVRSAYHGYAARGAETDTVDKSLGLLHTTVALSRLFQGESGQVYCGAQNEVVPHPLSSLRDEQGRGTERRVNLQDPVVAAHWGAHGEWRLRPSDMEGESLGRMAELIGFTPDRFRERFDNVAGWGI